MASGRLFQARGPATAKARSPSVDLRVAGTARSDDVTERRRHRDSMLANSDNTKSLSGVDKRQNPPIPKTYRKFSNNYRV